MRKNLRLILAVSLILLSIVIAYFVAINYFAPGIPSKPLQLISIHEDPNTVNVTQGMSFAINLTITSMANKELSIPLNLSLYIIRNSTGQSTFWQNLPGETVFTFRFEPDSLTLEPYGSNSSLLTVVLSEDAPIGRYQFSIETGNSEETHVSGTTLFVYVNPK
jgi:hypothetical protein